jgi:hypothetical protein
MIDWSAFDRYPENEVTCRCGAEFSSHTKFVNEPAPHIEARKPCPKCGRTDDISSSRGAPETWTIERRGRP